MSDISSAISEDFRTPLALIGSWALLLWRPFLFQATRPFVSATVRPFGELFAAYAAIQTQRLRIAVEANFLMPAYQRPDGIILSALLAMQIRRIRIERLLQQTRALMPPYQRAYAKFLAAPLTIEIGRIGIDGIADRMPKQYLLMVFIDMAAQLNAAGARLAANLACNVRVVFVAAVRVLP